MNCEQFRSALNAWVDRQLEAGEHADFQEHLRECADCRAAEESTRILDVNLRRAFQSPRAAASRVADRVVAALPKQTTPVKSPSKSGLANWSSVLFAMAIGFLIAVLIFRPWRREQFLRKDADEPRDRIVRPVEAGPAVALAIPVAKIVIAAGQGDVEFSDPSHKKWQRVAELAQFGCPTEGALRTTDKASCELKTSEGCVVRMNGGTEVVFHSARQVEVKRGEIWCRSTVDAPLEILPSLSAAGGNPALPQATAPVFSCTACDAASFLTAVQPGDHVRVTAAAGEVSVKARNETLQLKASESATITRDRVDRTQLHDRLLAVSWMQPLLVSKGYADRELWNRVDELLAQVGATKLSMLYEEEIRSLGEYGVLPLLRYVQSPRSGADGGRRLTAMQIISDLAPSWAIGDLIGLLSDENAEVRFLSAAALERLTRQNQGCPAEKWRKDSAQSGPALAAWQSWWSKNRERYPVRLGPLPVPPARPLPLKARGIKVRRSEQGASRAG